MGQVGGRLSDISEKTNKKKRKKGQGARKGVF
jgi:hypothetical protein